MISYNVITSQWWWYWHKCTHAVLAFCTVVRFSQKDIDTQKIHLLAYDYLLFWLFIIHWIKEVGLQYLHPCLLHVFSRLRRQKKTEVWICWLRVWELWEEVEEVKGEAEEAGTLGLTLWVYSLKFVFFFFFTFNFF